MGWTAADLERDPIEVWPDCWDSVDAFFAMSTQWRVGPSGAVGLDYNVLPWVLQQIGLDDVPAVFADLRIMELAALNEMRQ